MKCQKCDKLASFHITEITDGEHMALHMCPDCAKDYLEPDAEAPPVKSAPISSFSKQLKIGQTAEELAALDEKQCPICGISFYEFRQGGRLGCPNDYTYFAKELEPLLTNVHGATRHTGKRPDRGSHDTQSKTDLIRLRREMKDAVDQENYELASELRDRIKSIEGGNAS